MWPVVVLCGGLGTRLAEITGGTVPKALVPVAGRPFIDYKLDELARQGFHDVVLSVGIGADEIRRHVGDGAQFGITVRYKDDGDQLLGTGGAVARLLPDLPETFWLTYGDTLLSVDIGAAEDRFRGSGRLALMTVLHNRGVWERSNAVVRGDLVAKYGKHPVPPGAEHIDYGMLLLTQAAFRSGDWSVPFDLERVLEPLAERGELLAMEVHEPFHDIGSPEALRATEEYLQRRGS
jgi:NDP-sugar pyrophosphorylase family protein